MSASDPRIDAYVGKSAEFARPILAHLREVVHEGCPQVVETLKWSMPAFEYKGLLCSMAAFKRHCTFGFWKHELVVPGAKTRSARTKVASGRASASAAKGGNAKAAGAKAAGTKTGAKADEAMGEFGRITRLADLPPRRVLVAYVRKAAKLNEDGVKLPRPKRAAAKRLVVPADLAAALRKNRGAAANFADFSYSHRREYIEWLTEAKTDATRQRRLATAIEWIAEGKGRNWRYERR